MHIEHKNETLKMKVQNKLPVCLKVCLTYISSYLARSQKLLLVFGKIFWRE